MARGEIALIFISFGITEEGGGIITPEIYSSLVLVVIITTIIAPILLKISMPSKKDEA